MRPLPLALILGLSLAGAAFAADMSVKDEMKTVVDLLQLRCRRRLACEPKRRIARRQLEEHEKRDEHDGEDHAACPDEAAGNIEEHRT